MLVLLEGACYVKLKVDHMQITNHCANSDIEEMECTGPTDASQPHDTAALIPKSRFQEIRPEAILHQYLALLEERTSLVIILYFCSAKMGTEFPC